METVPPELSRAEVAARLGVTTRTVDNYRKRGLLPAYRVGPTVVRFRVADVDALFAPIDAASAS